jgi:hypothetical protein
MVKFPTVTSYQIVESPSTPVPYYAFINDPSPFTVSGIVPTACNNLCSNTWEFHSTTPMPVGPSILLDAVNSKI